MFRCIFALLAICFFGAVTQAGPVSALAYRGDGAQLAVGSRGVVTVLDSQTGATLHTLPGQDSRVTALGYFQNATLAVASGEAGKTGIVRLYDGAKPAEILATIPAHKDAIYAMTFSPDGKILATAGYDRTIKLWAMPLHVDGKPLAVLTDHSDAVYALAFSPNGKLLASGSADRAVKLWDVATYKRLTTLSDCTDWVYAVAWHPSGKTLYAAGVDKSLRAWAIDGSEGKLLASVFAHEAPVSRILLSPKGDSITTVGEDRFVKIWDSAKLTETKIFPRQTETILAATLDPTGTQLALGLFNGVTLRLNATTGDAVKPKPPGVSKLTPEAGKRGATTKITITGTGFDDATKFTSDTPGVTIERLPNMADTASERMVNITLDNSVPIGMVNLKATGPGGASPEVPFWVDRFDVVRETGSSDSAKTAMPVTLPVSISGQLDRNGDVDFYRFEGLAGQELGVQILSASTPAKFAPVLTLTDENGTVLVERAGTHLGFVLPKAGQYSLGVRDQEYRGGADMNYRLHLGPIPIITATFPLGVEQKKSTEVRITGVNLTAKSVRFQADVPAGSHDLPVPRTAGEPLGSAKIEISEYPTISVQNPVETVTALPQTLDGVLAQPGAKQLVRFTAKKGEKILVEVKAGRLGSPLDSFLEILDAQGQPVERATLRSVAKTYSTFRDHDSTNPGIRLETWNELAMNEYLYCKGELLRIVDLPRGPDDDCKFVSIEGKRFGHLGTTPTQHANGSLMYKVEIHPPGRTFPPNGFPVFPIYYRNDDGGPFFDRDSRLLFEAPADGTFQVRLSDANQTGSSNHAYRLTLRTPRPDFAVKLDVGQFNVWKNGGVPVALRLVRTDDFTGPVTITARNLVAPFTFTPTSIEAEQTTTVTTLAASDAAMPATMPGWELVATATIDGQTVTHTIPGPKLTVAEKPDLTTTVNTQEVTIQPGKESRILVKIERLNGHAQRVPLDVNGLPHGVRVLNIGLSGILVTPDRTEREIVLYAEPWVKPQTRAITVFSKSERKNSQHTSAPVTLVVK
jgi:WD domain, G-beta repeat